MVYIAFHWWRGWKAVDIADDLNLSSKGTIDRWIKRLSNVTFDAAICQSEPIGGVGKIVEIDESKFGKGKYNRGKRVDGQ